MDWQTLGAFLVATMIILATPGPVMATVIGNTVNGGQAIGFRTVLGIMLGESVLVCVLAVSLLSSSQLFAGLFPWLSLASAAYLMVLAVNIFLNADPPARETVQSRSHRPFVAGFAITVSNPAALLFYSAFFTSFVHGGQSLAAQLWSLAAIFILVSLAFDTACVLFVARLSARRTRNEFLGRIARFCSAIVYLGASAWAISSFMQATP